MHKKTTLFFDFDGVIAETDSFSKHGLIYAAKTLGIELTDDWFRKHFYGKPLVEASKKFLGPLKRSRDVDRFVSLKKEYDSHYLKEAIPYQDALTFIKKAAKKYRLFVVTGSRRVLLDMFMTEYNLAEYFEDLITSEEYSSGKPSAEPYIYACKKHGIKKQEVIIIEDSPAGHKSAKKENIDMVIVRGDKEYSYTGCLDEVSSFGKLERLLQ